MNVTFLCVEIRAVKRQNCSKFSYGSNSLLFDSSVGTDSMLKNKVEVAEQWDLQVRDRETEQWQNSVDF